jgi:hypothetical protein
MSSIGWGVPMIAQLGHGQCEQVTEAARVGDGSKRLVVG